MSRDIREGCAASEQSSADDPTPPSDAGVVARTVDGLLETAGLPSGETGAVEGESSGDTGDDAGELVEGRSGLVGTTARARRGCGQRRRGRAIRSAQASISSAMSVWNRSVAMYVKGQQDLPVAVGRPARCPGTTFDDRASDCECGRSAHIPDASGWLVSQVQQACQQHLANAEHRPSEGGLTRT